MDEITTFNTAVVAADQALTDAQAAAQEHGNLSDEYWQALSAQYDAAQAVVAAFSWCGRLRTTTILRSCRPASKLKRLCEPRQSVREEPKIVSPTGR